MKLDREDACEAAEVLIGRIDRKLVVRGDRADQEVGIRALDAFRSTAVVKGSRLLVIPLRDLCVGERAKVFAETVELRSFLDSGEDFLTDRTNQCDAPV